MSKSIRYQDRMSESDALLWNNERDPMLRSTILSVQILDGTPDPERFRAAVERSLRVVPRLRQRVALDPIGAAPPRWEADPHFDLGYHFRRLGSPGDGSLRALLDMAEPIAMQAFDKDRPLWELYQVDGLEEGRSAILMKLHHAVSDGVGLVRMTSSLVERSREPRPPRSGSSPKREAEPEETAPRTPFEEALEALRYRAEENLSRTQRAAGALRRGVSELLRDPIQAASSARELVGSVGRLLRPVSDPLSPLMTGRSLGVRFDAIRLSLGDLKQAAKAVGGTLNDAFVAAVTGGLRLYHESHGQPVDELRMTMPINLREGEKGQEAGNQFAPARFNVPIGTADPVQRMREIHERVLGQRAEPALRIAEDVSGILGRLPRAASVALMGSMLKAVDFVTSNVPGPPFTVYVSGARVEHMLGFGPLSGAAANVTLFSYDGEVQIAINTDRAAVPDPEVLVECLEQGVAEVLSAS
ncbi:MAG: wax ester/triacylglycerol synthase family O-acyltransferase [Proteobacteria bacterium]|nr:wax ester/triacylglycerol synthase family O-acyltransferase [Pseudomonadota bacterium]